MFRLLQRLTGLLLSTISSRHTLCAAGLGAQAASTFNAAYYQRSTVLAWMFALASLSLPSLAFAGDGDYCACACCGQHAACQKICRLVKDERKIPVTCWGCKCEEFCLGGPSHVGCVHCEEVCNACDPKQPADPKVPYSLPKTLVWKEWIPRCSTGIYTRKRLMRKTETKTVPSFKWVVEDLCPHCEGQAYSVPLPPGEKLPPLPVPDAKVK